MNETAQEGVETANLESRNPFTVHVNRFENTMVRLRAHCEITVVKIIKAKPINDSVFSVKENCES